MADPPGSEPTFYETLGVDEDASAAEVRTAYRERAKDTHPDVSDAPDAGRRFRRVKRAHEVLTDERERRRYDRLGHESYVELEGADRADRPRPHPRRSRSSPDGTGAGSRTAGGSGTSRASHEGEAGRDRGTARDRSGANGRRGSAPGEPAGARTASDSAAGGEGSVGRVAYGLARWLGLAGALVDEWQSRIGPAGAATALATFAAYPVLLASTVTPLFPVPVNALVGTCTLGMLAYLVLRPAIGVAVLGAWLLMLPFALTVTGVGVVSLGGLYALVLTGVPLLLCVVTLLGGMA